jgi:YVTN family beta-propeller protein
MKQKRCFFLFFVSFIVVLTHQAWADIMVELESPAKDQKVSGIGVISGWAFSTTPGAHVSVSVSIDGQAPINVPCCVDRVDVAKVHGDQALNSGFGQTFNFNLLSGESHKIIVTVSDDQGGSVSSPDVTFTTVKPGGFEVLSLLDLLFADPSIDGQELVLKKVNADEKGTNKQQEVTIRLAWQPNTQVLGIVKSENTGSTTTTQTAQAEQAQSTQTQAEQATSVQTQAATDAPITVTLENPPDQKTASGIGVVSGWAVSADSGATISSVKQRIDKTVTNSVPCCSDRADVAQAFPNQSAALQSGFGALYNFNLLPTGSHTIGVEVKDSTDVSVAVDNQVTIVKLGGFESIDNFDLSGAEISLQGQTLVLDKVKVTDKATQAVQEVSAHYAWQESCQCFVAQDVCGNGSVEPTEECDEANLAGEDCTSLGFSGGTITCRDTCEFETKDCTGGPRLYVTNVVDNTVSVIDTATNAVVGSPIRVGTQPRGIAITPNGVAAYVTNFRDDTVSVIDIATNAVTNTIALRQAKGQKGPQGIAIAPDGTKVYTVNGFDNTVSVIDTNTNSVTDVPVGKEPQEIALTSDGKRAYVTSFATNSVTVLDLTTNTTITTVAVGQTPDGVAVSPGDKRVYVANYNFNNLVGENTVSVINTETNETVGTPLPVGFLPVKIAFSPDGSRAYVATAGTTTVEVIDNNAAVPVVLTGLLTSDLPNKVVVGPKGKRLYVALFGRDGSGQEVEVLSPISNATIALITVGKGPIALALTPFPTP